MPHEDGTLTKGEMRDIDRNRRILAQRATKSIVDALLEAGVDRLQPENLTGAVALAFIWGQDDQRSRAKPPSRGRADPC